MEQNLESNFSGGPRSWFGKKHGQRAASSDGNRLLVSVQNFLGLCGGMCMARPVPGVQEYLLASVGDIFQGLVFGVYP